MPTPLPAVGASDRKDKATEDEPEFLWAGEVRRHIGTVVHGYLCRIAREGVEQWDEKRVKGETAAAFTALRTLGLGPKEARQAALHAVDLVARALSDKKGRWLLSAHPEGVVEFPLTGVVNGEIVHAIIDRTFVDGGVRWVVDYKTGTHEGSSVEAFLESERERYRHQLDRYAALLRAGGETREIKKGLYYPALGAWVDI
jgi:ATP-dependent exoDNAse (exonuclease V) beta subunit